MLPCIPQALIWGGGCPTASGTSSGAGSRGGEGASPGPRVILSPGLSLPTLTPGGHTAWVNKVREARESVLPQQFLLGKHRNKAALLRPSPG